MLFNSFEFALFLPLVFAIYWMIPGERKRLRNGMLLVASYVFYGWWDERFLLLIVFSTLLDFSIGKRLGAVEAPRTRKYLLYLSLAGNLGVLGFFKYYNFFIDNFITAFSWFGLEPDLNVLTIVLPVGISFYTFQTLSYTIDVYRRKLAPTGDLLAFAAYVSFFPQLVAGPIERATHLLPQFLSRRQFDYHLAVDGLRQILWGFFKKLVIADNCAVYANMIFNSSEDYTGSTLLLGAFFFAFQIYGDFSGYSDIAIGTARLFGFDLRRNFAYPYFSRDIAEFWRRWHISLSTWFRDYLYIPLGGSRGGRWQRLRNIFIVFIVSGFWHGANWTFLAWGALHAVYYLPVMLRGQHRQHMGIVAAGRRLPSVQEFIQMMLTFLLVTLAWVFFRAESLLHAFQYLGSIFSSTLFTAPDFDRRFYALQTILLILFFITVEWNGRRWEYGIERVGEKWGRGVRWCWYILLIFMIGMFMQTMETPFIYFQF
jgi:D-alanyl-lipoteichoic acid acyltransferase DltB (MBOAT superfamily)